ncbi:MAG: redoxin domain-containing protein [Sedimentisphaerales bacterium]|nr:redoxin domain-containing protein [Sedimentisphaerales bacterium]
MKSNIIKLLLILSFFNIHDIIGAQEIQKLPITGQVVDYMAKPVEDAEIAIIEVERINDEYMSKVIAPFVKTDGDGIFEVQANVTSQYDTYIVARKKGLAYAWDGLNYGGNTKGKGKFLLVLEKANTLTGKVVDYKGNAVPGAAVHAIPKTSYMSRLHQRPIFGPKEWFITKTDENGIFSFDYFSQDVSSDFHIKAPYFNCTYKFTTHIQNACGFEVWRSDIKLALPQEGKINGRVVEEGTNTPAGGVKLLIKTGRDHEDILNRYLPVTVVSNSDGSFSCEGLPEGNHIIELFTNKTETADWIAEPVKVEVSKNKANDNIEIKVKKGGIVEYSITEYETKQTLSGMNVTSSTENLYISSVTNQQGISRQRLLPGEYQPYASGEHYEYSQIKEPFTIKEGEVAHVDIKLDKIPPITGTVSNTDGKPAEDILVVMQPAGDQIYTNKKGNYTAWYEQRWASEGLYMMARDIPHSLATIVHTYNFNKPVQLSLSPALTIKGKIADPNGSGIPAARVDLSFYFDNLNATSDFGEEVLTDVEGIFELKAIPPLPDKLEYRINIQSTGFASRTYQIHKIEEEPDRILDLGVIELQPLNMSISGTVEDANGVPQPHSMIFLSGREGVVQPNKNTATDEQGRFEIRGVREGPLLVAANFSSDPKGRGTTKAYAGDKGIKIVLGKGLVHEHVLPYKSLKDEIVPDISDFGIAPNDSEGKNILVCFFDIEQRPSRNCILELTKKAQELKAKDIEIIAVQASMIEQEYLDSWLQENNISFPVGMIKDNEKQTKFNWGVKALPWLILTDKEHIVKAEGFSINELEGKIKEFKNVKQ